MKNDLRTPRLGMAVALCVALTAVWLVALYGTYEESQKEKYDVRVSPGAVTYGTHSTAIIPMVTMPTHRSSAPMISGGAIRSYAHSGHATAPSVTSGSGFKMHTTSSATVHTIGSGGGGGSVGTSGGSSSSSRGISYSGVSVSIPTLALATPTYAAQSEMSTTAIAASPGRNSHIRKAVVDDSDGESGERRADDTDPGKWWYWDENEGIWVTESEGIAVGTLWNDGGTWYRWDGSDWVPNSGTDVQDPTNTPIGSTPWLVMLLLAGVYGILKTISKKQNAK